MFKTILVPTDGSEHANKAVDLASDLATKYGAGLVILSVVQGGELSPETLHLAEQKGVEEKLTQLIPDESALPNDAVSSLRFVERTLEDARIKAELAERIVEEAKDVAEHRGVQDVQTVTKVGSPAQLILELVDNNDADLIVMGSRGLGGLKGLIMGSVSQKVSHLAPCSCVTVKWSGH